MRLFWDGEIHSVAELEKVYARLMPELKNQTVILLSGEVGSGKTTSVQIFLRLLGFASGLVSSPSFAIHHRYEDAGKKQALDHVDLYRLRDEEDLDSTGFWDLFSQKKAWVVVEWADRLRDDIWPLHWRQIKIHLRNSSSENQGRRVKIEIEN